MIYKRKHNKYMIRNRILIVYLLFISISILTGCCINQTVNETELTYGDDLINLVEETMKQEPREENEIQITKAEIVSIRWVSYLKRVGLFHLAERCFQLKYSMK